MVKAIFLAVCTYFIAATAQAVCGGSTPFPEIVPCPTMPHVSTWPKCDKTIPIHRIHGDLYYWHDFMSPENRPCELEIEHFAATVNVKENLNSCEIFTCDPNTNPDCTREILLYPYFVNTITATRGIAGQNDCSRRKYVAEGCFVEGTNGRVFVASQVDYDLPRREPTPGVAPLE